MKKTFVNVTLTAVLVSAAFTTAGSAVADIIDLSTGVAILANGTDTNGNNVAMYDPKAHGGKTIYDLYTPGGEKSGNHINDVNGDGYADMHRTTRNTDEADAIYHSNPKYAGVIDWSVTRDAKWTTVYTVADTGTGAPGTAKSPNWGSEARQKDVAAFLHNVIGSTQTGFIDAFVPNAGAYASTAELYGNASIGGTNYNQGGLSNLAVNPNAGVIGQSGGYYFDEAGQYSLAADGTITFHGDGFFTGHNAAFEEKYGVTHNTAGVYDDWNQHGLVTTGLDLIAYATNFNAVGGTSVVSGLFNVLGTFLDIYINGNKISRELLGLTENLYGTGNVVGEYSFNLDLMLIDPSYWNSNGENNIAFMVKTVSPWELGLDGNVPGSAYNREAGFNYFSADIQAGDGKGEGEGGGGGEGAITPEPATMLIFGLGLAGLGLARRRKNKE